MAGNIKVGGNTIFTHTGAVGAGTVSLGTDIRLPAAGGIKDSSGNNILTESGGNVSIGAAVVGGVPAGAIMSFAMSSAPTGWIVCNGAEYAIADYGDLHTAIGTTWGSLTNGSGGAGTTHFRVPDLRGEFLRGFDNGQGNDPDAAGRTGGDAVGSSQSGMYSSHSHNIRGGSGDIPDWFGGSSAAYGMLTSGGSAYGGYVQAAGGNENRPRNKYVQYCIKY